MARRWMALVLVLLLPVVATGGTVTRGTKTSAGGGTAFADQATIEADELNEDFDRLYNLVNGNIDGDNLDSVPWSKLSGTKNPEDIDDTSATATERDTELAPGTAHPYRGNPTLATDLEDEIQQLRHQILRSSIGLTANFYNGTSAGDASWIEAGAVGPNLIRNGMFQIFTGAANAAPDGWSKVATPTTIALTDTAAGEGDGKDVNFVSAGSAADGISQAVGGLNANNLYLIVARVKANTGACHLTTSGGAASGNFQDLAEDHASTSTTGAYETLAGIVQADSSAPPTDITVQLVADTDATADSCNVRSVAMYEIGDDLPSRLPILPVYESSTDQTQTYTSSAYAVVQDTAGSADMEVAVTVPSSNYAIFVFGSAAASQDTTGATDVQSALWCLIDENGTDQSPFVSYNLKPGGSATTVTQVNVMHVNLSPSSDTTYTYQIECRSQGNTYTANPDDPAGNPSQSTLLAVAVPLGG